jgi:tripartite-type tricarboxylate transporter receptor subunit TctC
MNLIHWGAVALAAFPGIALAAYPERPITMIVAYVPGGGTDVAARALAPYLEKQLGQSGRVVVVNRGGAGGEIGFTAIANAPADGYTIGFINSPAVQSIPIERPAARYSLQSFDYIGNVVDDPASITVHADAPFKDLSALLAWAKANPGAATTGTPGIGTTGHIVITLIHKITGVPLTHVPFKGTGDVKAAMAGRQLAVAAIAVGEAMQAIKGGTSLRIIAQMGAARSTLAPEVPTAREQGFNLEMGSLRGLAAPKGLPADVREVLVRALERAVAEPEFRAKSVQYYAPLRYLSPANFEAELREADVQLRQIWKESPWTEK